MAQASPPRLVTMDEHKALLEPLLTEPVSPHRLEQNRRALQRRIAESESTSSLGIWRRFLIVVPAPALILIGFGALALAAGLGRVAYVLITRPEAARSKPALQQVPETPPLEDASAEQPIPPEDEQPTAVEPAPRRRRKGLRPKEEASPPAEARAGELAAQVAALKRAQTLAKNGDCFTALENLAELQSQFPSTPLEPEIDLLRLDCLMQANQRHEAAALLEKMVGQSEHRSRAAELYQVLGDQWLILDQCAKALPAYRRALELGLVPGRAAVIEANLVKCDQESSPE